MAQERKGKPDAEFMKGVVKTAELPTATASGPDHYVVIAPGGEARFMTVQEVSRSFGVPAESPLAAMLNDKKGPLTVNQAVGCLGRSVHAGVARRLVATLMERGTLARGLTYGSAYSGVDTFAAAVEAEMEVDWKIRVRERGFTDGAQRAVGGVGRARPDGEQLLPRRTRRRRSYGVPRGLNAL